MNKFETLYGYIFFLALAFYLPEIAFADTDNGCANANGLTATSGGGSFSTQTTDNGGLGGSDVVDIYRIAPASKVRQLTVFIQTTFSDPDLDVFLFDDECLSYGDFPNYDAIQSKPVLAYSTNPLVGDMLQGVTLPANKAFYIAVASFNGVQANYYMLTSTIDYILARVPTAEVPPRKEGAYRPAGTDTTNLTGVWWDPARPGQGVQFIDGNGARAGVWYTYDANGEDTWVTLTQSIPGSTLFDLRRYTGPSFNATWDFRQVDSKRVGSATLFTPTSSNMRMSYSLDGKSGTLSLVPFVSGSMGKFTGIWWDPLESGRGMQIVHQGNQISGAWYLFDGSGIDQWYTFAGSFNGESGDFDLLRFSGPALGTFWNADLVRSTVAGTARIEFSSDTLGSFEYNIGGSSGKIRLQPFSL